MRRAQGLLARLTRPFGGRSQRNVGDRKKHICCSFCRKSFSVAGPFVAGHDDAYICGECIERGRLMLENDRRRRALQPQAAP